jgi:hypothetical protein
MQVAVLGLIHHTSFSTIQLCETVWWIIFGRTYLAEHGATPCYADTPSRRFVVPCQYRLRRVETCPSLEQLSDLLALTIENDYCDHNGQFGGGGQ